MNSVTKATFKEDPVARFWLTNRVREWIDRRFACRYRFCLIHDQETTVKQLCSGKTMGPFVIAGNQALLPMYLESDLIGAFTFEKVQHLSTIDQNHVANLITLAFNADLKALGSLKANRQPSIPCLIESKNPDDSLGMALEIHESSSRGTFLRIDQLANSVFTQNELSALNEVTLYIPEVSSLTLDQQRGLYQLLIARPESDKGPYVLSATTLPYPKLRHHPDLNKDLLSRLSTSFLRLARPLSEYRKEGTICFFIDTLLKT